jgi:hypothetical protein
MEPLRLPDDWFVSVRSDLQKLFNAADLPHIADVVARIKPLLAGRPPGVQGAILADLLAIWLAGHQVAGDAEATRKLRAEMLAMHLTLVRQLVPVNAKIIGATPSDNVLKL